MGKWCWQNNHHRQAGLLIKKKKLVTCLLGAADTLRAAAVDLNHLRTAPEFPLSNNLWLWNRRRGFFDTAQSAVPKCRGSSADWYAGTVAQQSPSDGAGEQDKAGDLQKVIPGSASYEALLNVSMIECGGNRLRIYSRHRCHGHHTLN